MALPPIGVIPLVFSHQHGPQSAGMLVGNRNQSLVIPLSFTVLPKVCAGNVRFDANQLADSNTKRILEIDLMEEFECRTDMDGTKDLAADFRAR